MEQQPEAPRVTWPGDAEGEIEHRTKKERDEQERAREKAQKQPDQE